MSIFDNLYWGGISTAYWIYVSKSTHLENGTWPGLESTSYYVIWSCPLQANLKSQVHSWSTQMSVEKHIVKCKRYIVLLLK